MTQIAASDFGAWSGAGTVLVANGFPLRLTNVNGTLWFVGYNATNGSASTPRPSALWKSDGTTAGTVLVKDINPGSESSEPGNLANVDGTFTNLFTNIC